jgi:hypothetical protein
MCVLGAHGQHSLCAVTEGGLLDINKGEKILEHESVVWFWVISGDSNVFILLISPEIHVGVVTHHVDCNKEKSGQYYFLPCILEDLQVMTSYPSAHSFRRWIGLTLKLTFPSLYSSTNLWYTGRGLEPVGRPSTKWVFSADGLKRETLRAMYSAIYRSKYGIKKKRAIGKGENMVSFGRPRNGALT